MKNHYPGSPIMQNQKICSPNSYNFPYILNDTSQFKQISEDYYKVPVSLKSGTFVADLTFNDRIMIKLESNWLWFDMYLIDGDEMHLLDINRKLMGIIKLATGDLI